jgi:hypothetical protein
MAQLADMRPIWSPCGPQGLDVYIVVHLLPMTAVCGSVAQSTVSQIFPSFSKQRRQRRFPQTSLIRDTLSCSRNILEIAFVDVKAEKTRSLLQIVPIIYFLCLQVKKRGVGAFPPLPPPIRLQLHACCELFKFVLKQVFK